MNNIDFRILVIDDNPAIHHDFLKILTTQNVEGLDNLRLKIFGAKTAGEAVLPKFQIDVASQGQEGVECIKQGLIEKRPYSLAFVDIRMPPGWDGIETIKHIWEIDKDVQVVICTAYSDYSWEETVAHLGKTDNLLILKKPFDNISVRQLACALTKKWQLLQDTRKFTSSLKQEVNDRTLSLQRSLSLVKATLESSDEGIIVISNNGKIIDYNQKFLSMWEIPAEVEKTFREEKDLQLIIKEKLTSPNEFINWLQALNQTDEGQSFDVIPFNNGKILDCYSQPQTLNNKIVGRVLNFRDITGRKKLENELQFQAKHDALTGLPNRVLLLEKMREEIRVSEKSDLMCAVMFLDLDRFKLINDSLSHAAGDKILCLVAERLQAIMREEDTIARLGGDEFVIVLARMKNIKDVISKANKIVNTFQTPFSIDDRYITVTASIGISIYPRDGISVEALLRNADAAMYKVKEFGSNNFQFYSKEMNEESLEKLEQEMQLRQAIGNNEFFLYYQPQFDLAHEKLIAVEALLRWHHPKKGILTPMDFVPLAEETGLIIPIGEWVIRAACKQNKAWQEAGFPFIRVAVNVTSQQLKQQNIVDLIRSILEETDLGPQYLELELTENIVISSMEVMVKITELKALGVNIAIDDFGTGYSSLSYLRKLPLDRLKIDSSFIKHIHSAHDDEVIIRAIIAVAKNLNLEVLAEGVETQNQINFLKAQKCDEIQGFYYSKPLSVEEIEKLFTDPLSKEKILDKNHK